MRTTVRGAVSGAVGRVVGVARPFWRWLTSMRTALLLLFLLAVAAIPGSLLPQRNIAQEKVTRYLTEHPDAGPWLDRLGLFDVYASPWFSAIYLLLFISLVGCLVPRLRTHAVALVRRPPDAPRRLDRMPAHAPGQPTSDEPAAAAGALRAVLRRHRFRAVLRRSPDGAVTVSGEKGYLKETGNLLFHFALLAVLVGVGLGSWYGWHANRLIVEGADGAFCDTLQQYDEYGLGPRVDAADLPPFCVRMDSFHARYADSGQPLAFSADMAYTIGDGPEHRRVVAVNEPLRLPGANLYLLGHGYAPVIAYTDRYGKTQTSVVPFPTQDATLTSQGVAAFPDANVDPKTGREPGTPQQVAFDGVFLPTVPDNPMVGRSAFPGLRNPSLMLQPYRGDLGMDSGVPSSVYTLNQVELSTGRLVKAGAPVKLKPGEAATLDDGTSVRFVGIRQFATVSVRYDPGEKIVLVAAGLLVVGLLGSLVGRRRRVWFRVRPGADGGSVVEAGGLSRTDSPGFVAEFNELVRAARDRLAGTAGPPAQDRSHGGAPAPDRPPGDGSQVPDGQHTDTERTR